MTTTDHIDQAIVELTRAKVTLADDPSFALARLTDARFQIAVVTVELGQRAPRGHRAKEKEVA